MTYNVSYTDDVEKELNKLYKKNRGVYEKVKKKINRLRENPYNAEPLKADMKNRRSEHLPDSKVMVYEIDEETKTIKILKYGDHGEVYGI